jgi:acylphosphatase
VEIGKVYIVWLGLLIMKKAARFVVQGTVQGIFFRQFTKEHADGLGLTGFVRNLEDGTVEVVVEGEPDRIEQLAGFLRQGPEHAQIRNVSRKDKKWSGEFKDFKVLRF